MIFLGFHQSWNIFNHKLFLDHEVTLEFGRPTNTVRCRQTSKTSDIGLSKTNNKIGNLGRSQNPLHAKKPGTSTALGYSTILWSGIASDHWFVNLQTNVRGLLLYNHLTELCKPLLNIDFSGVLLTSKSRTMKERIWYLEVVEMY